jgi:pimeloyl-ACP methyl ester carboxylesterase
MTLVSAQQPPVAPANYDEAKVPKFELPDPLKTNDGRKVDSTKLWNDVRRPELLALFEEHMFGKAPLPLEPIDNSGLTELTFSLHGGPTTASYNGNGTRYQVRMSLHKRGDDLKSDDPRINVLIYKPNNVKGKIPAFIGLNFQGNHTVDADPGIWLGKVWKDKQLVPATEQERGSQASRWQVEKILDRGYAVITAYYGDIEPDFDGGSKFGIRRLIDQKGEPNEANAIATWAWGLELIRDWMVRFSDLNLDPDKIIVIGHSRLGKTALWAGATNPKFAMVISNDSGCGGAALSRREFGETVHRINTNFPHWFCGNFKKYNLDVNALPFDQHELVALIAPRPVYIASAVEDRWADPKGEFLSGLYADPVYQLFGTDGIAGVTEMPELDKSVGGTIGYHIRTGKHDVTEFDWEQYLNFADKHFRK